MKNYVKKNDSAFTLLELIVVIAITAILAAVASNLWPGTRINLNAQAQQLASDIRYTQTISMSRGANYQINFLSSTTYNITDTSGNIVNNPVTGTTITTLLSQTSITRPPSNLPNNLISFDSEGAPYIDSSIDTPLSNPAVITLTSGANSTTITIQPETGRITVP